MLKGLIQSRNTRENKKIPKIKPPNQKMALGTYISIITLNVNEFNAPTKRQRLAEQIQKQDPYIYMYICMYICCLQETHFRPQDTQRLKVRGWKNIFHANGKQKKPGVAVLISDKIHLKIRKITRDKEEHYVMLNRSIQEGDITIVNIYAPNKGEPQYIRRTLRDIKGEIDSNTIIAGDFNIPLTPMDRSSKQKSNKETQVLNDTLVEMDFIDIIRTFHSNIEEYIFSKVHMEHSLGYATSWVTNQTSANLRKFKSCKHLL